MSSRPQDPPLPGFFRITRWTHVPGETFWVWRDHFNHLGIQTRIVQRGAMSALYREGVEAVSYSGWRMRRYRDEENVGDVGLENVSHGKNSISSTLAQESNTEGDR